MAEFFAVSSDDSGEEEEEIGPWFSSPSDDEIDAFYRTPVHSRSDGSVASGMDSDMFVPVFSPHYQYMSSDPLDHEVPSDSEDESCYVDDQFSLPADLPERSSLPLDDDGTGTDVCPNSVDPLDFGVLDGTEDMGSDYLRLGFGFGMERQELEGNDDTEAQWRGVWGSDYGDDEPSTTREAEGLRIVGFGSDTESDLDDGDEGISSETIPFFDCGCAPGSFLNDLPSRGVNDDFEWEEVEERLENSENLDINQEDEEQRGSRLEWEFLLTMNSLHSTSPADYEEFDDEHAEFGYSSENEILFEQFGGQESFIKGSPPTAKHVIEDLPSIVLTQSAVCAICKDEISPEENPKQLPCSHNYHAECIIPWLRMKNTCPVCRHELPTDDPDYELQRVMGAVRGTVTLRELEGFN